MKYLALFLLLAGCAGHSELEDMGYKEVYNQCNALVLEDQNGTEMIEIQCRKDEEVHSNHPRELSNP